MDDTHPAARRMQIELLRKAGPERRAAIASQLSNTARWRTRQNIARAHPDLSPIEQKVMFVRLVYGRELALRFRALIEARPDDAR